MADLRADRGGSARLRLFVDYGRSESRPRYPAWLKAGRRRIDNSGLQLHDLSLAKRLSRHRFAAPGDRWVAGCAARAAADLRAPRARADDRRNAGRQRKPERRLLSSRRLPALVGALRDPVCLSRPGSFPPARQALGALGLRPRGTAGPGLLRGRRRKARACSIKLCSKRHGSRGSTSTSRTPLVGPRSAPASTPTT